MTRLVVIMLVLGTMIGVMMPSGSPSSSNEAASETSEVSGSSSTEDRETSSSEGRSSRDYSVSANSVRLERQDDGHFYAKAQVNGANVNFMVDTGASGIALSTSDARRAGLQFSKSEFEVVGRGASGPVEGKYVTLDRVRLGNKSVEDTEAVILDGGDQSLLGQSFLQQFGSVEIKGDTMVLR